MNKKCEVVHFRIDGDWYTDHLRSLWGEHSPMSALRIWMSAFPDHSTKEIIEETFLPLVAGKMKFIGDSSAGMELVPDDVKIHKSMPLFDSFEDELRYQRIKLFYSELELQFYRMNRRAFVIDEDYDESILIKAYDETFNTIMNMCKILKLNSLEHTDTSSFIPTFIALDKAAIFDTMMIKEKRYFREKYGQECIYLDDPRSHKSVRDYLKVESLKIQRSEDKDFDLTIENPFKYEEKITDDRPKTTKYYSGWIAPDGKFYGCGFQQHINFSEDLINHLGMKIPKTKNIVNEERFLEEKKFIKVSSKRYYWSFTDFYPTKCQINTIKALMKNYGQEQAIFGYTNKARTFNDALIENEYECDFNRRIKK